MVEFDYGTLEHRLRELAFLNSGVRIVLTDARHADVKTQELLYDGGLIEFVSYLDRAKKPLIATPIAIKAERDGITVEVAMWWNDSYHENVLAFTNNIPQRDGGTHLAGFRGALTRQVTGYAETSGIAKKEKVSLTGDDCREGLTAVLVGEGARSEILVADQGQAGFVGSAPGGRKPRQRGARHLARGASGGSQDADRQGGRGGGGARGGAQGARTDAAQGRARHHLAARQARRLPGTRSGQVRNLHRRGRFRRRLGQGRALAPEPGDPAAARQDPQCRARALRPHARLRDDRHADHRARHLDRQGRVQRRQAALPQDHHHDRRRRRRRAYPHAAADLLLPADAGTDRARPPLHRPAAALQGDARQELAIHQGRRRVRGIPDRVGTGGGVADAVLRRGARRPGSARRDRRRARRALADQRPAHALQPRRGRAGGDRRRAQPGNPERSRPRQRDGRRRSPSGSTPSPRTSSAAGKAAPRPRTRGRAASSSSACCAASRNTRISTWG